MKNRIFVFVDAANVWSSQKRLGKLIDHQKISKFLAEKFGGEIGEVFYYESFPRDETRRYETDGKHKFFTFLKKGLGFIVRKKELKQIRSVLDDGHEIITEKGNMDVEITIDAVFQRDKFDTAVFFTGDSDFLPLITFLRNLGKKIFVFSTKNAVSTELRTGADGYFDLKDFPEIHGSKLFYRRQKIKNRLREEAV